MPKITVPLIANYDAISRPIMVDLSRKVLRICSLPEDTPVTILGEFGSGQQLGKSMGDKDPEMFNSKSRLTGTGIDAIKNMDVTQMSVRNGDYPALWEDKNLGIGIRPVYISSEITLSFRYIAASRSEAIKFRDEHAARRAEARGAMSHEVKYDIPIQDGVINLLAHLHSLREGIAGYGDDFSEYFKKHQARIWIMLATQDMDEAKMTFAVPEKQRHLVGYFDFDDIPVENKVDGNTTWEIEFTYKLSYLRCTHLYIHYPLMVHQQHVGADFFDPTPRFSVEELDNKYSSIAVQALDSIRGKDSLDKKPFGGIRYPTHDEWIPGTNSPKYTKPVISWMIALDPKDPQYIMDLNDLPDMRLTLEMVEYFKACGQGVFKIGRSAINVQVWCGEVVMKDTLLEITEDLKLYFKAPVSLRSQYHVRLCFTTFYDVFTQPVLELMQRHPYATLQIFRTIMPMTDTEWAAERLLGGRYLDLTYIEWFYNFIRHKNIGIESATIDDFTQSPWDSSKGGNDPGIGSGSTWKKGDYIGSDDGTSFPGEVINDNPNVPILPDSFRGKRRGPRYVQFLAIMAKRR